MVRKISKGWFVIGIVFIFATLAILLGGVRMSENMQADANGASSTTLSQMAAGTNTKIVMEVAESDSNTISGWLLESVGSNSYRRTAMKVRTTLNGNTKVVMGSKTEIHPGAVLHVSGLLNPHREIQAQQLVILTGYVKVK